MNDQDLVVDSTGGLFPHTHKLAVPCAALKDPPANGLTLTTSVEYSLVFKHSHQVHLTAEELSRVREGRRSWCVTPTRAATDSHLTAEEPLLTAGLENRSRARLSYSPLG